MYSLTTIKSIFYLKLGKGDEIKGGQACDRVGVYVYVLGELHR